MGRKCINPAVCKRAEPARKALSRAYKERRNDRGSTSSERTAARGARERRGETHGTTEKEAKKDIDRADTPNLGQSTAQPTRTEDRRWPGQRRLHGTAQRGTTSGREIGDGSQKMHMAGQRGGESQERNTRKRAYHAAPPPEIVSVFSAAAWLRGGD